MKQSKTETAFENLMSRQDFVAFVGVAYFAPYYIPGFLSLI